MNQSYARPANSRGRNTNSNNRSFGGNTGGGKRYGGGGGSRRYGGGGGRGKQGAYIDPAKFVNKVAVIPQEDVFVPINSFNDFAFSDALKRNIALRKYEQPSAIQDGAIPPILEGKDLIGLANTGTGKTAAFVLPIIERLQNIHTKPAVLIMAPTRELANQINDEFRAFAQGMRLYSALCVGGMNMYRQVQDLRRNPQVIIGTPGRLKDHIQQGNLKLNAASILVLDEADQMLDMGFIADIRFIVGEMPAARQSLCFSATITPAIETLIHDFLRDPVTISVRTRETSDHVEQDVIRANTKDEKFAVLKEMLDQPEFEKVLVFGETKHGVQRLADDLTRSGHNSEAIHGNKTQPQRQRALKAFKDNRAKVLVATDVAARGLDIPNVSHVINFDQPNTYQDYVHRIGRTGRAGKKGKALTFVPR